MIKIEYPNYSFRIRTEKSNELIFDEIRKMWLRLTPEEWVRQNFIQYLVRVRKYPSTLIAVEKEIRLGELKKRFDILVYDQQHQPWMMVECKEMNVELNESILQQILQYNIALPVSYMVITNGHYCIGCKKEFGELSYMEDLPTFSKF